MVRSGLTQIFSFHVVALFRETFLCACGNHPMVYFPDAPYHLEPVHPGLSQVAMMPRSLLGTVLIALGLSASAALAVDSQDLGDGVFARFSRHIQRQVESDKIAFTKASGCTNWFYQQEKRKSAPPGSHAIRLDLVLQPPSQEDCLRDYPGGLDAVRQDFHRTQTSLSVSLTFYEFALVGDRDDDARYSREELGDLFQSLALGYDPTHSTGHQSSALNERFDAWYRGRNLESLMNSMGELYEKGYRVSAADRAELDRVTK
jgi:hypothetical protein